MTYTDEGTMTEQEAVKRHPGLLPKPNPACRKCQGSGTVYDPPLEQQEREIKTGKRSWHTRKSCDCFGVDR